mmetsp:Transcript_18928/g.71644  ORF Transcript_18928/g.71644 Transcript_18928/m.71644 type:complete len:347 (+) Transcript_18928:1169-2209(+)
MRGDARPGRAQRVSDRYGSTVHVAGVVVEAQLLCAAQVLSCEGLVDLHNVNVVQGHLGRGEHAADGFHRPDAHDGRVASHPLPRHHTGKRLQVLLCDRLLRGHHKRRGAIADARGRSGRHSPAFLEHRRQLRQRLERRLSGVLIGVHGLHLALHLDLHRSDLRFKHALSSRLCVARLRLQRIGVAGFSGDVILLRQVLRGDAHWRPAQRVRQPRPERVHHLRGLAQSGAPSHRVAVHRERRRAHVLRTATKRHIGLPKQDRFRTQGHRLEARAAQAIHRESWRLDGPSALQSHVSRQIRRVRRRLDHVAHEDCVHRSRVYLCRGDGGLRGVSGQIRAADAFEGATE